MLTSIKNTLFKEKAYSQSAKLELALLVLTPYSSDKLDKLRELIAKDPLFAAKTLIFARIEYNLRTISHIGAVILAKHISGNEWGKSFYDKIVSRVDDMTEILSCYFSHNKERKLPNALKKGFAIAFNRFNNDHILTYSRPVNGVKLSDVVNLVHPFPTFINSEALRDITMYHISNGEEDLYNDESTIEEEIDGDELLTKINEITL